MKELILEVKFDDNPLDFFLGIANKALNKITPLIQKYIKANDDPSQKKNIREAVTK